MKYEMKSKERSIVPSIYSGSEFTLRIPSGNVKLIKNGPLTIRYFFTISGFLPAWLEPHEIFAKCRVELVDSNLSSVCPELEMACINVNYTIIIPKNMSFTVYTKFANLEIDNVDLKDAKIFLENGNAKISKSKIGSTLNMFAKSGNFELIDVMTDNAQVNISDGNLTIDNSDFKSSGILQLGRGNIRYYYPTSATGKIYYNGPVPRIKIDDTCYLKKGCLVCNKNGSSVNLHVEDGNLTLHPRE